MGGLGPPFESSRFPSTREHDSDEGHLHRNLKALGLRGAVLLTLKSGSIGVLTSNHRIATEGGASTDNAAEAKGGYPGMVLILHADDTTKTVVVKHNDTDEGTAGNRYFLDDDDDYDLDDNLKMITFLYRADVDSGNGGWQETGRSGAGHAAFFCHDYLVDSLYTGTEGAVISSPDTAHTFKIYSEVEPAIDHGIANLGRAFSVEICTGVYVEDLEIPDFSHEIHLYGQGADATIIGGNTVDGHSFKTATVYLYDLTLDGPGGGYSLTSGAAQNCKIHATNVTFKKRMAGDHAGSEFYDCLWKEGIQFEAGDTPDTVLIVGGVLSSATGLDFTVATGSKSNWDVRGLRMDGAATLKLRQVTNSRFSIHFLSSSLNDQVAFTDEASHGIVLDCFFAPMGNGGQVISNAAGLELHNLQIRGIAGYSAGISDNATRWFDNDGIVVGGHFDMSHHRNGSGNRLEDDITGPSYEGDFRECKFTLTPTDVEIKTTGSSTGNVVDSGVIQAGSVGISGPDNVRKIIDTDRDTSVDTEESADEDKIRFKTGGVQRALLDAIGFQTPTIIGGTGVSDLLILRHTSAANNEGVVYVMLDEDSSRFNAFVVADKDNFSPEALSVSTQNGSWTIGTHGIGAATDAQLHVIENKSAVGNEVGYRIRMIRRTDLNGLNAVAYRVCYRNLAGDGDTDLLVITKGNIERVESVAWFPLVDATYDFGSASQRWKDGYYSGTFHSGSATPTSIQVAGSIVSGADQVAQESASLDLVAADRALILNRLTTTQRDALTALDGMALYNTTVQKVQSRENGAWVDLVHAKYTDAEARTAVPSLSYIPLGNAEDGSPVTP